MRVLIIAMLLAAVPAASAQQQGGDGLATLLAAPKFEPTQLYTGADTPEDRRPLTAIIDRAISDIQQMPQPRDAGAVRTRLAALVTAVDDFATQDRAQAYRYCIHIWRAAGFTQPSQLFEASDFEVLLGA